MMNNATVKMNEGQHYVMIWNTLQNIVLSEKSKEQLSVYSMLPFE